MKGFELYFCCRILFLLEFSFLVLAAYSLTFDTDDACFIKSCNLSNQIYYNLRSSPINNIYYINHLQMIFKNSEAPIIYEIVNRLFIQQQIDPKLIDNLSLSKDIQLSSYAGLINLLYNQAVQSSSINSNQMKNEKHQISQAQVKQQTYDDGSILRLRGKILKQYAKFLAPVIPEPAYSLIRFQFDQFNKYCSERGLQYLIRHTRGIYPEIDTKKVIPLQFLPFYDQLDEKNPILIGNRNWKMAKRIMQIFYQQQIKTGNLFYIKPKENMQQIQLKQQEQISKQIQSQMSNQINDQKLNAGIRLCYILMLGKDEQMKQYIESLNTRLVVNCRQGEEIMKNRKRIIQRLKFWYSNYSRFLNQGLQMYEQSNYKNKNISLIYDLQPIDFEQTIIFLIEKAIQQKYKRRPAVSKINQQFDSRIGQSQYGDKFIWLVHYIKDDKHVPQIDEKENSTPYFNNNKLLLLAYTHVIHRLLIGEHQSEDSAKSAYLQLITYSNHEEDPYNRIFFNDEEILQLYSQNKIKDFPSLYNYGSELTPKIFRSLIQNNPSKFIENLDKINLLQPSERLRLILTSRLIGNINDSDQYIKNSDNSSEKNAGEKIIQFFDIHKKQLKNLLWNNENKLVDEQQTLNFYNSFIKEWKTFYSFNKTSDNRDLIDLLKRYKIVKQNKKKTTKNQMEQENKIQSKQLKKSDVIFPTERPDIFYQIVYNFVVNMQRAKNIYKKVEQAKNFKQKIDQSQMYHARESLLEYMKIAQYQQFKQMLLDADPAYSVYEDPIVYDRQVYSQDQQQLQDYFWKIYGETYLLLGEYCKNLLVSNPVVSQHHMTDRDYNRSAQISTQKRPAQSINVDGDQDEEDYDD